MAVEGYEAQKIRREKECAEFTNLGKPMVAAGRDVIRRGFAEVLQLIDKFVEQLGDKNAQPATASKAFEAMMTKSHSLQSGVTASESIRQDWYQKGVHPCLHSSMRLAIDNAVQSMYIIGGAMRQDQQTVIGKVSLADEKMVANVKDLLADVQVMLKRALEMDTENWNRLNDG